MTARTGLLAGAAAAALALAACSSSGGSVSNGGSSKAAGAGSVTDVAAAMSYVGGTAGKADASKSPVTIGFIGQNGGTASLPEEAVAAEAAVKYVNNDLGGIDGHPLNLVECSVGTSEEQGVQCAQKFLNDKSISAITSGGISTGNQSFYQTLNGAVPFINGNISLPVDATAKNTIILDSGILGAGPGLVAYITKYLHPKSVAIVYPNLAQTSAAATNTGDVLKKQGVTVTTASFPPSSTDLLSALIAAKAATADVVIPFVYTNSCVPIAKTLQQLGRSKPVVGLGLCIDPSVKSSLGDYPKWTIYFPSENPYQPSLSAKVRAFLSAMHTYAGKDANIAGFAGFAFASVLTAARVMNKIGGDKVSRASVSAGIKNYTGEGFMLPPLKCGSFPQQPALCTLSGYVYNYQGNDKWLDPTNGAGIAPAAS